MPQFKVSHINGPRLADEIVVYENIPSTGTNPYGMEAVVEDGVVVSVGSNDNAVPANGYVISGHGKGAEAVRSLCAGAKAAFDREAGEIDIIIDDSSRIYGAKQKLDVIKQRFEKLVMSGQSFYIDRAVSEIERASAAIEKGDVKAAEEAAEEAYYLTAETRENEIRAIWHRPKETSAKQVEATVSRLKDAGFNMILIETNYEGYANAAKTVKPWLPLRKELENADCDIIEEFIKQGKKQGVQIHAWLEDFFFGVQGEDNAMLRLRPDLIARTRSGGIYVDGWDCFIFLNPALQEVHDLLVDLYRELLEKYDFDGIQLDYIRYPVIKDIDHSAGFEEQTKKMFLAESGIDIDKINSVNDPEWTEFVNWRASRVTSYVKRIVDMVAGFNANGRNIKLSTAVFGDPDEAIKLKCQNWLYWVKQRWLDYIFPMAYLSDAKDVEKQIRFMVEQYGEAPNVSGISPMYGHLPVIESTKQVEACRRAGAAGVAFFETVALTDIQIEKLKEGVFRK